MTQFNYAVTASFAVTFQLIVFLMVKSKRVIGESERISKLGGINFVDSLMHGTVCATAYLGLI